MNYHSHLYDHTMLKLVSKKVAVRLFTVLSILFIIQTNAWGQINICGTNGQLQGSNFGLHTDGGRWVYNADDVTINTPTDRNSRFTLKKPTASISW